MKVIEWGAAIVSLRTADRDGAVADIVLGYEKLEPWLENPTYFGATIGRVGNRIAKGKFTLEGVEYTLACNNDANTLHGGPTGFHKRVWSSELVGDNGVKMSYTSAHMEEGYPGELKASVTFTLNDENELSLEYGATTDQPTIVNLTNHSYFNLGGAGSGDVRAHEIKSPCRFTTPVSDDLIPTGELGSVEGTPFDFREQTSIGARIDEVPGGYDHNYVVNRVDVADGDLAEVSTVTEPSTGRTLKTCTTEPGCQLYCGGFLDGTNIGREGVGYVKNGGFCLETQHYPDSCNQLNFPQITVTPEAAYASKTVYTFGTTGKRRRD